VADIESEVRTAQQRCGVQIETASPLAHILKFLKQHQTLWNINLDQVTVTDSIGR
jgi:hypothetical protein